MSINRVFVRDVTIVHPLPVASGYGNGVEPDYSQASTTTVKGWLHQLSESEQQSATRDASVSTHVLRVPAGTVVLPDDRVVVDGQAFDVDGPASVNWTPRGEHHVRVPLVYVDG